MRERTKNVRKRTHALSPSPGVNDEDDTYKAHIFVMGLATHKTNERTNERTHFDVFTDWRHIHWGFLTRSIRVAWHNAVRACDACDILENPFRAPRPCMQIRSCMCKGTTYMFLLCPGRCVILARLNKPSCAAYMYMYVEVSYVDCGEQRQRIMFTVRDTMRVAHVLMYTHIYT